MNEMTTDQAIYCLKCDIGECCDCDNCSISYKCELGDYCVEEAYDFDNIAHKMAIHALEENEAMKASNQNLFDIIGKLKDENEKLKEEVEQLNNSMPESVEQLTFLDNQENVWIPCNDHLPENDNRFRLKKRINCLITTKSNSVAKVQRYSYDGIYYDWGRYADLDVVAWMPIPKPYKRRK